MSDRSRRINVLWTFKGVNRKAGGMAIDREDELGG